MHFSVLFLLLQKIGYPLCIFICKVNHFYLAIAKPIAFFADISLRTLLMFVSCLLAHTEKTTWDIEKTTWDVEKTMSHVEKIISDIIKTTQDLFLLFPYN